MKHFITGLLVGTFLAAVLAQEPPGSTEVSPTWEEDTWDRIYEYIASDPDAHVKFNDLEKTSDLEGQYFQITPTPPNSGDWVSVATEVLTDSPTEASVTMVEVAFTTLDGLQTEHVVMLIRGYSPGGVPTASFNLIELQELGASIISQAAVSFVEDHWRLLFQIDVNAGGVTNTFRARVVDLRTSGSPVENHKFGFYYGGVGTPAGTIVL